MSVQLQSISSAVFFQLSCNVSALAYSVMQLICCDRPATRYQLSYKVQAHLPSVISVAISLLSHDMSAWHQSVSSAAKRQLSSGVSAQLSYYLKAQLQLVSSAVRSAATHQLSCTLLAEMKLVISAATCSLSAYWNAVHSAAVCQLGFDMSAQQYFFRSAAIYQFTATRPVAVRSIPLVRFQLLAPRHMLHSTSLIHHHQLRMTYAAIDAG